MQCVPVCVLCTYVVCTVYTWFWIQNAKFKIRTRIIFLSKMVPFLRGSYFQIFSQVASESQLMFVSFYAWLLNERRLLLQRSQCIFCMHLGVFFCYFKFRWFLDIWDHLGLLASCLENIPKKWGLELVFPWKMY